MSDVALLSILRLEHAYVFQFQQGASPSPIALYGVMPFSPDTTWQHSERAGQAVRLLNQLIQSRTASTRAGDTPQIDPLLSLGRLIYNQFFPPTIQQTLHRLPAGLPLIIATNDTEIPWEIAHDGESYLALKYAVGRRFLSQQPVRSTSMQHGRAWSALLIGNPTADLQEADAEMEEIRRLIQAVPGTATPHILMRRRATREAVLEALAGGQYDLIHYSGHAVLAACRPEASGLVLAGGQVLHAADITKNLSGHPTIFLNACESARSGSSDTAGLSYIGQAAQNLAAAFVQGGAQAFIGTFWPVLDQESRRFAFAFYRRVLVARSPIGTALREARAEIRQPDVTNPLWASFTLYGEPDALLPVSPGSTRATATVLVADVRRLDALYRGASEDQAADAIEARLLHLFEKIRQQGGRVYGTAHGTITCVFGTPTTHQNDAECAVRAALDIARMLHESDERSGQTVSVGVGIASGHIFVREATPGEQPIMTVTGLAVSQASWLAQRAGDGTILVTAEVRSLVRRLFVLTRQEPPATGATEDWTATAYPVHQVQGEQAVLIGQMLGHQTGLVGRTRELAELQDIWQACSQGSGQLVGIGGEAGIGKSRLLCEFYRALTGEQVEWVTIACPATHQPGPFWLVKEAIDAFLGLAPEDARAQQRERLAEIPEVPPGQQDAQARQRWISSVVDRLSRLLSERSARAPLVILIEDLHWADMDSLEALNQLWGRIRQLRVLVISSFRSEVDWQPPWRNRSNYHPIRLQALDPRETRELLAALLDSEDAPQDLTDAVLQRSEGSPFFVRELVTALQESGVLQQIEGRWHLSHPMDAVTLPGTIQRLIQSRIERLPEQARLILPLAAVAGDCFEPEVLQAAMSETGDAAVLERGLAQLENAEFIYRDWELNHCHFGHVLVQEIAYRNQRNEVRQRSHRRLGHALALIHQNNETGVLASLAHHFYNGVAVQGQLSNPGVISADADPADLQTAATYLIRAAEAANRSYAAGASVERWQRALRVLDHPGTGMPDQRAVCHEGLGDANNLLGSFDEATEAYRQAFDLHTAGASQAGSSRRAADLARRIGRLYGWQSRFEEALSWMETGLQVLGQCLGDAERATAAMIHVHTGTLHYYRGHYAEAEAQIRQGLDLVEGTDRLAPQAEGYNLLGAVFDARGDRSAALDWYQKSLSLWEAQSDTYQAARVEDNIGIVHFHLGRWDDAEKCHWHALSFFEDIGDRDQMTYASLNLGNIHLCRGEWAEATQFFERARQLSDETGNERILALSYNNLGLVALEQENWIEARSQLQRSLDLLHEAKIEDFPAETYTALAMAHLGEGKTDAALAAAQRGLAAAQEGEMDLEQGVALRVLGMVHQEQGNPDQAEAYLRRGLELLRSIGARYESARTLAVLAALCRDSGRLDEAQQHRVEAISILAELGAAADLRKAEGWPNQ